MLKIRLFGSGQAKYYDRSLAGFPNQQASRLFCYLLLNKQKSYYRERLATVFWSDYPTHVARKYLRNALWRLRQILESAGAFWEEYFWIADDSISFVNSSSYWLDIEAFEQVSLSYQDISGEDLTPNQAHRLETAADLYIGDLLDSIYEDWCLYDRERFRISYMNILNKLVVYHGANENYERGVDYGNRLLALDATREKVHQQMMWLHSLLGDRQAALEQYKRCQQVLLEELGIRPMKETQRMYEQIIRNRFNPKYWLQTQSNGSLASKHNTQPTGIATHQIVRRLDNLQGMINEVNMELKRLEGMLNKSIKDA